MKTGQEDQQYTLEQTVVIRATMETVFSFFTDSDLFARWWGPGSLIEGHVGGRVEIRYPNGVLAGGRIISIDPPVGIVFSYGYEGPDRPLPFGDSVVRVSLYDDPKGTRLVLVHELRDASVRDMHVQGWRFQLAVFARAAAARQNRDAEKMVDAYLRAWNEPEEGRRLDLLRQSTETDLDFADDFGVATSRADLALHIAQVQRHFPGVIISRATALIANHDTAVCGWTARAPDGSGPMQGTNVFRLSPEGRIKEVTGISGSLA